jgi:hypothetical protein
MHLEQGPLLLLLCFDSLTKGNGELWLGAFEVFAFVLNMEGRYLVDPASSHMLVSKIKPCKS